MLWTNHEPPRKVGSTLKERGSGHKSRRVRDQKVYGSVQKREAVKERDRLKKNGVLKEKFES